MKGAMEEESGWKPRLHREVRSYLVNFVYLAVFFGLFTWYRRLILAEYRITYLHYGVSLVEALVLAKVAMLGSMFSLDHRFQDKPLIVRTLYLAFVFTIWTAGFGVIEHTVTGLALGRGLTWGLHEVTGNGRDELLARCLILFCAFLPLFAFKELSRRVGLDATSELFLKSPKQKE